MQTQYLDQMPVASEGLLADMGNHDILTFNNPFEKIPFGNAVAKIPADADGIKLPDSDTAEIVGVSVKTNDNEGSGNEVKSAIPVLRKGRIYVKVEADVTPDSVPHFRYATKPHMFRLSFSTAFVSGNRINMKVNGAPMSEVVFTNTSGETFTILRDTLQALPEIETAALLGTTVLIIAKPDVVLEITDISVIGGLSQPTHFLQELQTPKLSSDRGKLLASTDGGTAAPLPGAKFLTEVPPPK